MGDDSYEYDIFISYSSKDIEFVRDWLCPQLEMRSLRVAVDFQTFTNRLISDEIRRCISASRYMLTVVTENYPSSAWAGLERETLVKTDPQNELNRHIPCRFEDCPIPATLDAYIVHDLRDEATREDTLADVLNRAGLKTKLIGTDFYLKVVHPDNARLLRSIQLAEDTLKHQYIRALGNAERTEPRRWTVFEATKTLALYNKEEYVRAFLADVARSCDRDDANAIRAAFDVAADKSGSREPVCLVRVKPAEDAADPDSHDVDVILWWGAKNADCAETIRCTPAEFEDLIPPAVKRALNPLNLEGRQTEAVEVVLPFELLSCDSSKVEQWKYVRRLRSGRATGVTKKMAERHPILLRCLDRIEGEEAGPVWLDIKNRLESANPKVAKIDEIPVADGRLQIEDNVVAIVADRPLTEAELEEVVFNGVPTLLWYRDQAPNGQCVADLQAMIQTGDHSRIQQTLFQRRKTGDALVEGVASLQDVEQREMEEAAELTNAKPRQ